MQSVIYDFLLSMWILCKIVEVYLKRQVVKGRLSINEFNVIVTTTPIY